MALTVIGVSLSYALNVISFHSTLTPAFTVLEDLYLPVLFIGLLLLLVGSVWVSRQLSSRTNLLLDLSSFAPTAIAKLFGVSGPSLINVHD